MINEIKKWWEDNSADFQEEHQIPMEISYGPWMPFEDDLNLMGDLRGKEVLEIGCGGAQCGIAFAKKGAKVTGIDLSEEQLKFAKKLIKKHKADIELIKGDMADLSKINTNSKDIVFSSWALFYVGDLEKCFKEVYRVLKGGGTFVFSTHHPFWRVVDKESLLIKESYFEKKIQREPHKKGIFICYKHRLGDLFDALYRAGFLVERVLEPNPEHYKAKSTEKVPKDRQKAMKIIPRTIIIKAVKKCQ